MKLRLVFHPDGVFRAAGQRLGPDQRRRQAELALGGGLLLHASLVVPIDKGALGFKVAVNALRLDQGSEGVDGLLVCLYIQPGLFRPQGFCELLCEAAVLGGELCRGVAGLPAADAVCLQNNDPAACLLQAGGREDAGHARANDRHLRSDAFLQGLPPRNVTAF